MKYTCPRCEYESSRLSSFKNHLNREKPCYDLRECGQTCTEILSSLKDKKVCNYVCPTCGNRYKSHSGYNYHKANCQKDIRIMELSAQLKELTTIQTNINNINTQNNINNQNNIQNNTINITINSLGNENTSHITPEFMIECIKNKMDGIVQYLMKKHFDPEHPENHNIKVDGDNYSILENPLLLGNSRQLIKKEPYQENYWATFKKDAALEEHILPRVETAFKNFLRENPVNQQKLLEEFSRDIVLPMDWTMELDDLEDEFDCDLDAAEQIKLIAFKKIKASIDEKYSKVIKV